MNTDYAQLKALGEALKRRAVEKRVEETAVETWFRGMHATDQERLLTLGFPLKKKDCGND